MVQKLKLKCFFRRALAYKMQGKFAKALGDVDKILAIESTSARALALREELVLAQLSGSDSAPAATPAATLAAVPAAAPAAVPPAPPTTLRARCLAHKLQGNAALKAKKLADAVTAYSAGIDELVSARCGREEDAEARHLLVTLYSNRAQVSAVKTTTVLTFHANAFSLPCLPYFVPFASMINQSRPGSLGAQGMARCRRGLRRRA